MAATSDFDVDGTDYLQTLSRGLSVIRAFGTDAPRMTLAQVAGFTGLSRAVARRCLLTLVHDGYAVSDGKHFSLSAKILELGYAFLSSSRITDLAKPLMEEVARDTGEICALAALDATEIVFLHIARPVSGRLWTLNLGAGSRLPAHATAMGRMLLAALANSDLRSYLKTASLHKLTGRTTVDRKKLRRAILRARTDGWCLVDGEVDTGLRSIAILACDRASNANVALNIVCQAGRTADRKMVSDFLPVLRKAAERISAALERQR